MATEKEGDKLHFKKIKSVAIILVLIFAVCTINTSAATTQRKRVILGGTPFGLKLFTNGVIVIEVEQKDSPAKKADIKTNDIIIYANDVEIDSNETLKEVINNCNGETVELQIIRNNKKISKNITPKKANDEYLLGLWIRDSTAGIGTVTYFDPENKSFGALGHGICDQDTGLLMPLKNGEIQSATISHYTKATNGVVGGLNGYFDKNKIGTITINNGYGIYGNYEYTDNKQYIEVAKDDEIKKGDAYILSTIEGKSPKKYSVTLSKINHNANSGQNMIVTVTDKELLNTTGGIIQGMSGSPIIQDGRLVGAVTHVFVNSPYKGYGISITNMLANYEQFN